MICLLHVAMLQGHAAKGMLQRQPCGVSITIDLRIESYRGFVKYDNQQDQLTAQQVDLEDE
jgi:hypothetical protein